MATYKQKRMGSFTAADIHGMLDGGWNSAPAERESEQDAGASRAPSQSSRPAATRQTVQTAGKKTGAFTAADVQSMLKNMPSSTGSSRRQTVRTPQQTVSAPSAGAAGSEVSSESIGRGIFGYMADQREYNKRLKELQAQAERLKKDPSASGQEKAAKDAEINALLREWQQQMDPAGTLRNTAERIGEDLRGVYEQWVGSLKTFGQAITDPDVQHDLANDYLAAVYAGNAAQAILPSDRERMLDQMNEYLTAEDISEPYTAENSPGVALQQRGQQRIERALEGVEGPGRFAVDVGNSMIENLPGMGAALIPYVGPVASMGLLGAQATGSRAAELSAEGVSAGQAFERGLVSGGIEVATEVIPVGNWADIVKTGAGKEFIHRAMGEMAENGGRAAMSGLERAARNIISQALSEGTEEAVSYVANYVADAAAADPNAEFSLEELIESAALGAASGAGFGLLGTGLNRAFGGRQQAADANTEGTAVPAGTDALQSMARGRAPADIGTGSLDAPPVSAASEARVPDMVRQAETAEAVGRAAAQMQQNAVEGQAGAQQERMAMAQAAQQTAARAAIDPQGLAERIDAETDPARGTMAPAAVQAAQARTAAQEAAPVSESEALYQQYMAQQGAGSDSEALYREYAARQAALAAEEQAQARADALPAGQYGEPVSTTAAPASPYLFAMRQAVNNAADADTHYTDAMRTVVKEGYRGQSPTVYMQAMNGMYDAGRTGSLTYEQALAANRTAAEAVNNPALLYHAWALGQNSVKGESAAAPALGAVEGSVRYEDGTAEGSTQLPAEVLDAAARKLGTNVRVVQTLTDGNGDEVNGHWAAGLAELAISEKSGNAYQTLVHETGEYIKTYNPEGWARLRSSMIGWYASVRGMGAAQRTVFDRYENAYGDSALGADEAARDLFGGVFSTEEGTRSFLEYLDSDETMTVPEKRSVVQTLRDILDRLIESIRALLRGGDATIGAAEGRRLAEQAEQMENCRALMQDYLAELDTARQNAQAKSGEAQQQNTAASGMQAAASEIITDESSENTRQSRPVTEQDDTERRGQYPQARYSGAEQVSYATLVSLPNMQVTQLDTDNVDGMSASDVITRGMEGLDTVPGREGVAVRNRYTGNDIAITRAGLRHGLHESKKLKRNGPYVLKIGEIIENAIKVNELEGRDGYKRADVYLGVAQLPGENAGQYVVRMIVDIFPDGKQQLGTIEAGLLYAHTGTKSSAPSHGARASGAITLPGPRDGSAAVGQNTAIQRRSSGNSPISVSGPANITIADFLQTVNDLTTDVMPGVLSQDVKETLGRNAKSELGDQIRFSRDVGPDTEDDSLTRLERENRELAWRVSNMQDQLARVRAEMRLSEGHTFSKNAIRGVASRILSEYESKYDRATLESELERIFAHIADGGPDASYQEAMETCTNLMRDVIRQSSRVSTELRDYYRPVREALRGSTIEVKEGSPIYHDLIDALGDGENGKTWGNVRRATFGRLNLRLVQSAGNADTFFAELAQQYPAVFDADAHPVDNIQQALGVFEASQPVYENPYGLDIESAAAFAGQELFEAYMKTPEHHTLADRQRQQMLQLRGDMIAQRQAAMERQKKSYEKKLSELRRQNQQRIGKMQQRMDERGQREAAAAREQKQEAVNRVRGEMTDKMLKQKAVFEQRMERRNEGMRWRQARDGVQKSVRRLQRWLQNPTDQAHVPERMRKAVLSLLTSFDWNTSRTESKAARDWRLAMKDLQVMALEMDNPARAGDLEYIDFDPDLSAEIEELIEAGKGTGQISALNAVQMQQLRGVMESVTRSITEANKLMAGEQTRNLQEVAENSIIEMEQAKQRQLRAKNKLVAAVTDTAVAERVSQLLGPDMMDAGYYFRSLGPKAESIYRHIREGFDKRVWHLREAQEAMTEILKGHNVSTWTGPKAKARDFELGGVHIKLTPGQIMELYCLSQREQAKEHLMRGGITVDVPGGKRNGPRVRLTPESLAEIVGTLTNEQVKMAQAMQEYLSTTVAGWGNEVSMAQYGVRKFNEPHYWPIKSNSNFTRTSDASVNDAGLWGIKNKGMTKATVKGANNPIILHDAFDTWAGHVAEMSTYNAWCIPLSDAMKWYNYRGENEISVKEAIEELYGKKGQNFFVQLMKDINGTDSRGGGTFADAWGTLQSRWKVAKVGFNLRVAVQQPTAYLRAGAVLKPRYLTAALVKAPVEVRRGMREALQYCAIAQWKNWGYFETNIGQSMRSILTGEQTMMEGIQDKSTALAELGDSVTWGTLWLACEDDVRDRMPELQRGTEAFKQEVARRLSEVIDRTQVVDTVLHRSQIMRSKDTLAKWATNFMAEPTKSYNMLREAAVDLAQGKQGSRAKFARTMATFTITALGTAAAAGLIDAMRSTPDKPDEDYGERYTDAIIENFADNINILNELPFVKDILSLLQGYDVSRNDMEATADTIDAASMWLKTWNGQGQATTYKLIYRTANALSEWTGLPVGGLIRDIKSGYDIVTHLQDPLRLDEHVVKSSSDMKKALQNGDTEHAQELFQILVQKKVEGGKSAEDAMDSVKSSVTDVLKPKYMEGTDDERAEAKQVLLNLTYTTADGEVLRPYDVADLNKWMNAEDRPELVAALQKLDITKAQSLANALVERKVVEGKTKEEATDSIKSSITETIKPMYMEGSAATRAKMEKAILNLRVGGQKVYDKADLNGWLNDIDRPAWTEAMQKMNLAETQRLTNVLLNRKLSEGKTSEEAVKSLRSSVTSTMKPLYVLGTDATRRKIEDLLLNLEFDGTVIYDQKDLDAWLK